MLENSRCGRRVNTTMSLMLWLLPVMAIMALAGNVHAEPSDKKERDALRKMRLMMQSVEQEKAALEQEKAALNEKINALTSQVDGLKSSSAGISRKKDVRISEIEKELLSVRMENTGLMEKLKSAQKDLQDTTAKQRETLQVTQNDLKASLEQGEEYKNKLKAAESKISQQFDQLGICEKKNIALYELNLDLMEKYNKKGVMSALLQAEPFTQIKNVEMKSIIQEYKDRIDSQKIDRMPEK